MAPSLQNRLRHAFRSTLVLRPRDLAAHGINRVQIGAAVKAGFLERVGRGLYMRPGAPVTAQHTIAEVAARIPEGVFCLLTALRFHNLGTQDPSEVWVALGPKAWRPRLNNVRLRLVHFSGAALHEGCEAHRVEGVPIRVYNPAKTVADCFKFRHKLGVDVALEALRETWRGRRATMKDLTYYARVCRVARVMQPYLEGLA